MLITNNASPVQRLARHVMRNTQGIPSNRRIEPFIEARALKYVPIHLSPVVIG
jgi:hypothetical protein